jgi:hypothetical protein
MNMVVKKRESDCGNAGISAAYVESGFGTLFILSTVNLAHRMERLYLLVLVNIKLAYVG